MERSVKFDWYEIPVHFFILVYCGLSVIFVTVDSYGFRAFIPISFVILPFSCMGLDNFMDRKSIGPAKEKFGN
jgi:hypothetical protein